MVLPVTWPEGRRGGVQTVILFPPQQHIINEQYCSIILRARIWWLAEKYFWIIPGNNWDTNGSITHSLAYHWGEEWNIEESTLISAWDQEQLWNMTYCASAWSLVSEKIYVQILPNIIASYLLLNPFLHLENKYSNRTNPV